MTAKRRERIAREKIAALYGTPEGEDGPTLFVAHHLAEVESDYWVATFGTGSPEAAKILRSLVLIDSWSSADDGEIDTFDFSLPGDITNYLLSVRFEDGEVVEVTMES